MVDGHHEAGKDRMLENLTVMSDDDRDRPLIRNEDTLARRAWIELALAGVKGRLRPAELGEGSPAPPDPAPLDPAEPRTADARPRLYLVRNTD